MPTQEDLKKEVKSLAWGNQPDKLRKLLDSLSPTEISELFTPDPTTDSTPIKGLIAYLIFHASDHDPSCLNPDDFKDVLCLLMSYIKDTAYIDTLVKYIKSHIPDAAGWVAATAWAYSAQHLLWAFEDCVADIGKVSTSSTADNTLGGIHNTSSSIPAEHVVSGGEIPNADLPLIGVGGVNTACS
jgi:hypothetical protein